MKKLVAVLVVASLCLSSAIGQSIRELRVTFSHSIRIPYHSIEVTMTDSGNGIRGRLRTQPMNADSRWAFSSLERELSVTQADFNRLWERATNLDYSEVLQQNSIQDLGEDGTTVSLHLDAASLSLDLSVWTPEIDTEERALSEYWQLFLSVIGLAGALDYLNYGIR